MLGKTALEIAGYGHFISQGNKSDLYLFAPPKIKLPSWFIHFEDQRKIKVTEEPFRFF